MKKQLVENSGVVERSSFGLSSRVLKSEDGKAISWAILLCALIIGGYHYRGREYFEQNLSSFHHMMVLMGGVFVCLAALGCGVHLMLLGGKSNGELRRNLKAQTEALTQLLRESDAGIRGMEADLGRCALKLGPRGLDCLAIGRRIVRALDRRVGEITELLASGDSINLIDADELSRKKLIIADNAMDSLIGSDPVPPLAPEEWVPSLKKIFAEIEADKKKYA